MASMETQNVEEAVLNPIGLPNAGNICYQSSLIQALFHFVPFKKWLSDHHQRARVHQGHSLRAIDCDSSDATVCPRCCKIDDCVICSLKYLFTVYFINSEDQTELRRVFNDELRLSLLIGEEQQDITELFIALSSKIKESSHQSTIVKSLTGMVQLFITRSCSSPSCPTKYIRLETELGFNCSIEETIKRQNSCKEISLDEVFNDYWRPIVVEVKCGMLDCCASKDRKYGPVEDGQSRHLQSFPEMVCIMINRYAQLRNNTQVRSKIDWPVTIPKRLEIGEYTASRELVDPEYILFAVIAHNGNASTGHYKAVMCEAKGLWSEADDEVVSFLAPRTAEDRHFEQINGYPPSAEASWSLDGWTPVMAMYGHLVQE